jgi:hypothetical protein
MEIFVNIDGVLRNTLQKFDYHYKDYYLNTDSEDKETFEYGIDGIATIENIMDTYKFQSMDEYLKFLYFDFPIEIFGHAGLSYSQAVTDFNTLVFENKDINFTLIGLNEKGKAKPSTLFFLSRNGVICDTIKFLSPENIDELWSKCDLWITDDKRVVESCPKDKSVIKFNTFYNNHFTNTLEINKLSEIEKTWLNCSEKGTTSI